MSAPLLQPTVYILDDDTSTCEAIARLLSDEPYDIQCYPSAEDFLAAYKHDPTRPQCLVTDVRMPGIDGLKLQQQLREHQVRIPIIFVTGYGDVRQAIQAMKLGAVDFLEKPIDFDHLRGAIRDALAEDRRACQKAIQQREFQNRLARLTSRELDVFHMLVAAMSTKEIAARLQINPKTVFVHRARVLEKMEVDSLVTLSQLGTQMLGTELVC